MPAPLPEPLLGESPATKFLYTWLLPQGLVSYPVRQLAKHTGLSYKSVSDGLRRLKALSLLQEVVPARPPKRSRTYKVLKSP